MSRKTATKSSENNQSFYSIADFSFLFTTLRADVCKYQPEVCNSEKFKILKKIHNIAHGKLLQEIHVLLRSDNYF